MLLARNISSRYYNKVENYLCIKDSILYVKILEGRNEYQG